MPPPAGIASPTRRFVVTQVNVATGVETVVITSPLLPTGFTTDQGVRPGLMQQARDWVVAHPGVYRVYSPASGAYWTDRDCVWDSRVSGGL